MYRSGGRCAPWIGLDPTEPRTLAESTARAMGEKLPGGS
jgi:hypothetical protein